MQRFWGISVLKVLLAVGLVVWIVVASVANRTAPPADLMAAAAAVTVGIVGFAVVRVDVDDAGVRIGLGPWSVPRRPLRWSGLSRVQVTRVSPFFGRGSRGVGLYCVRPGAALQFTLTDGSYLSVSVTGAEACLRAINEHRHEASAERSS